MDDFEGFKTSVKQLIAGMVEKARALKLEVELEHGTDSLPLHDKTFFFHDKTLTNEELFLVDEPKKLVS